MVKGRVGKKGLAIEAARYYLKATKGFPTDSFYIRSADARYTCRAIFLSACSGLFLFYFKVRTFKVCLLLKYDNYKLLVNITLSLQDFGLKSKQKTHHGKLFFFAISPRFPTAYISNPLIQSLCRWLASATAARTDRPATPDHWAGPDSPRCPDRALRANANIARHACWQIWAVHSCRWRRITRPSWSLAQKVFANWQCHAERHRRQSHKCSRHLFRWAPGQTASPHLARFSSRHRDIFLTCCWNKSPNRFISLQLQL